MEAWNKFKKGKWCNEVNVYDFIELNYQEYTGDESFLCGKTKKTTKVWNKCETLLKKEMKKHVLGIDTWTISGIDAYKPGFIDKSSEVIVGLQTEKPLRRIVNPFGGIRMVHQEIDAYNYILDPKFDLVFKYRKTHNDGVFDAYTKDIKLARKVGLITGLPDAYGRGRIIGDYRRVALYGTSFLKEEKIKDLDTMLQGEMTSDLIQLRENVSMQIKALSELESMALKYGFDISKPARNACEAIQWTYFAYLGAIKENNGAAMSLGRVDSFFDIYINRDLKNKTLTESEAQELIDQFIIKLRLVRHLRTPAYDELFSGDPTWVTCSIGGATDSNKSLVTKTSYRLIHSLTNLGPAPEPNITILWNEILPLNFKKYCAKMSISTDAIQYENDNLMNSIFGSDYAIACCVSAMRLGKDMQYFGARCNLAKALLYAINGGVDEITNIKVLDVEKINSEVLDYKTVKKAFYKVLEKVASLYVNAMNIIHYMHDKYAYEAIQMALHDTYVNRLMAYGVAGLSVVADSLSAIKYANVKPIYKNGLAVDFEIEGDFPKFGNDDDRVDNIAKEVVEKFYQELSKHHQLNNAKPTLSVLTITSNVVYGAKTGATPDGRKKGVPFAPGANPMHERDKSGALASLNSVSKIPYKDCCLDGISNTFSIVPTSLGKSVSDRTNNLVSVLDGYFKKGGHHLNVNVLNRETLIDAMNHPEKYPLLTIRVSGYAVRFNRLTKVQQQEVISRTFHDKL